MLKFLKLLSQVKVAVKIQHFNIIYCYEECPSKVEENKYRHCMDLWPWDPYFKWRAGATVGGYEESGKGIQKTVLFRSFQRLWLLFLFFSLKTCQDIKDDLVAENILILWKREWEQERESERRGYFINTAFNTYLKWRLSNFENMVNFLNNVECETQDIELCNVIEVI